MDPSFAVMYCVHVGLCSMTIALHGDEQQKKAWLPRLAAGEVGAYSLSEAGAGTDAAAMTCKAKPVSLSIFNQRLLLSLLARVRPL